MAKAKKSTLGFVCLALVAICAILAIVGVTQNWTVQEIMGEEYSGQKLSNVEDWGEVLENFGSNTGTTMEALGYLSVAAVCVVAVAYVIKQLISITLFRIIVILAGVVTMAIGVASIAYTASIVSESLATELGIGCYLTSIGASAGGLFAAVGCFKR